jgi:3-deoxy-D-manno-octulosonic-acid transferase
VILSIYQLISILLAPFLRILIHYRIFKQKECPQRINEKFGLAKYQKPFNKKVIWIHAVSVGEANSAFNLAKNFIEDDINNFVLFTTTTVTSAKIIGEKLYEYRERAVHQFAPLDSYFWIKRFLEFWNPKIICFVESEIWPNMLAIAKKKNIKTFLVNGRISKKTFNFWCLLKKVGYKIFDNFSLIFAQNQEAELKFIKLTNQEKVFYLGNLKAQLVSKPLDEDKLRLLKIMINRRRVVLFASTHKGEEEVAFRILRKLKFIHQDLLLILVIRHPERSARVVDLAEEMEIGDIACRSKNEKITRDTDLYLVDTIGDLEMFYKVADFGFIGGSLVDVGGHNPFEAIIHDCAIIVGPYVSNNYDIYENLINNKACIKITNEIELESVITRFLEGELLAKKFCTIAKKLVFGNFANDILSDIFNKIKNYK